jgi:heavy metal translocating P-type ATPase
MSRATEHAPRAAIALATVVAIAAHLVLRFGFRITSELHGIPLDQLPLIAALLLGGIPLLVSLLGKLFRRQFGSDLLAGISIATAALLGEYLAGAIVVLMLSGGEALEAYAMRSASSVLDALARRMPKLAHRKRDGNLSDAALEELQVGDELVVFPHEICPVDGTILEGRGSMDESYLTGEPYLLSKAPGAQVLSGAINGETALVIRADRLVGDSRYAKIMQVMQESEQRRPELRRLGDQLGAWYTPLALAIAAIAWWATGQAVRFLAVLVIATPCPLLIAIPVAIIGSISLAARRGIIIKDPTVLERIDTCRTAIFDKTGTLTYGKPRLAEVIPSDSFAPDEVLSLVASLERYSRHPLSGAIQAAAEERQLPLADAQEVSERPGEGLRGTVAGRTVQVTSRKKLEATVPLFDRRSEVHAERETMAASVKQCRQDSPGLECVVLVDGQLAATLRFRDEPRTEGAPFIKHLGPKHRFSRVLLVSGDRESEVRYLAERVGIEDVRFSQSPEQKLELVRQETARESTVFLGDGINDAPALAAATVGVAFGQASDITTEAAGAVIIDSSLERVDELLHIGRRMRRIALQSAVGGMAASFVGMVLAAAGFLTPVAGAILQEVIDIAAVVNALRMAIPPKALADYNE